MIWDDGKIIFDIVLKTAFLGTKGRFKQMVLVHGESYEFLMVRILRSRMVVYGSKTPIFGTFFVVDQYHSSARLEIQ